MTHHKFQGIEIYKALESILDKNYISTNYYLISCLSDKGEIYIQSLIGLPEVNKLGITIENISSIIKLSSKINLFYINGEPVIKLPLKFEKYHLKIFNENNNFDFKRDLQSLAYLLIGNNDFHCKQQSKVIDFFFKNKFDMIAFWRALKLILVQGNYCQIEANLKDIHLSMNNFQYNSRRFNNNKNKIKKIKKNNQFYQEVIFNFDEDFPSLNSIKK